MGTVVAIEATGGVAIGADTAATEGGTVRSENVQRIFEFDSMAAAAAGTTSAIQTFGRRLEAELRTQEIEQDGEIGIERLARIAAREAQEAGVDAAVAGRDAEGTARLREVRADGSVLENETIALGSGATVAIGQLDSLDLELDAGEAGAAVRDIVRSTMERDAETGGSVDVWTMANDGSDAAAEA